MVLDQDRAHNASDHPPEDEENGVKRRYLLVLNLPVYQAGVASGQPSKRRGEPSSPTTVTALSRLQARLRFDQPNWYKVALYQHLSAFPFLIGEGDRC
jgi:hypothetical protein